MLGRLISEVGAHSSYYSYDVSGNRTGVIVDTATVISYNYNSNGELVSETSNNGSVSETTAYEYDLNGNLVKKTKGFSVTDYSYNAWNQMVSAGNVTYTYNAQGIRVSKTVGNNTEMFVLSGDNVLADGQTIYVRGIELISNRTQLYLYNIRGDVIQLLGFDGEVDKTYDYDAYGNEYSRDLADENPFRYCGEYYDTETGFIYLRARYYYPTVGRFTTLDPIKDGLNWYNYCDGEPVNRVDPSGESAFLIMFALAFTAAFASTAILSPTSSDILYYAEEHYSRNELNVSEDDIDKIIEEYDLQSEAADEFHEYTDSKQGEDAIYNNKYLSPNGGHNEIIICSPPNEEPYVVDEYVDEKNMGTHNYASNEQFWGFYFFEHTIKDVLPYFLYGNTADDDFGIFKPIIVLWR